MRIAELAGKQIINISNGIKLGLTGESDVVIDPVSGRILSIIIPRRNNMLNFWVERQYLVIPWEAIKKIGAEVIIVDLDQTHLNFERYSV
ncbi:MAG: YlmC/YmxH family sporulation protein [Bacillota bacterium]|jgi:YlmC/YmxH family sporulation protein